MNHTPLRYPGGKSLMAPFFTDIIKKNNLEDVVYAEPYAGGAGAAITLLLKNKVKSIEINDISLGIFSFWHYLINKSSEFLKLFETTKVTLEEWQKQRKIFLTTTSPSLQLGFATFFLSRTNRSGILNAGPMGGQNPEKQEKATYKLDCRYNKDALLKKLEQIIERKTRIKVFNLDALTFLKNIDNKNTFIYLDPPYYKQGKALYINFYKHNDHLLLSQFLRDTNQFKWILSYDNVKEIQELYSDFNLYEFNLTYTAHKIKVGTEFLTHSSTLILPADPVIKRYSKEIRIIKNDFIRKNESKNLSDVHIHRGEL